MKNYRNFENNKKRENYTAPATKCVNDPITAPKADQGYSYYSKVLKEPFDSIEELREAEEAYYAKQKAKEDKAAQKKADANKVEEAFKAMNAARKTYKEKLTQLTSEYAEELTNIKNAFELGKKDLKDTLAKAEDTYAAALKEFTDKYPEGYHLTLKDGDFETTISGSTKKSDGSKAVKSSTDSILDLFDLMFNF